MNATPYMAVKALLAAQVGAAGLSRLCGVQRSTAMRWVHGSVPRKPAREKLNTAAALIDRRPQRHRDELPRWLDRPNPALLGITPSTWIREGRDASMLGNAWAGSEQAGSPALQGAVVVTRDVELQKMLTQLSATQRLLASVDLGPLLRSTSAPSLLGPQVNLGAAVLRNHQILEAGSIATLMAKKLQDVNVVLQSPISSYAEVMRTLPKTDIANAFAGMRGVLSGIESARPYLVQPELLAQLAAAGRPPIGALAVAMDLQLATAVSAALYAFPAMLSPVLTERVAWQGWFPSHPGALVRTAQIDTEWLLGETHNAAQASVAPLGRDGEGVDEREVAAAVAGVTSDFPDLLAMPVPGTGANVRGWLNHVAPDLLQPLQGAIQRLRGGGADDARQAAASLRAALDKLAMYLVPGSKTGRLERYELLLGVREGDSDGTLLHYQIGVLYASYQPLSDAVHDELNIDAVRANAYGIFSALVAILARLDVPPR
jgi:hypothetical protein